jgi:hypothetical protein
MLYQEVIRRCRESREERRDKYAVWRQYYLFGSGLTGNREGIINKIYPHIDQITAFMYSQETTRFNVNLGASVSDLEIPKLPIMNRAVNDQWNNSNADIVFGQALLWSFVYGSTFVKTIWRGDMPESYVIEPHNFSVLREDVTQLSRQEAYEHSYWITRSQLENELASHPSSSEILKDITEQPKRSESTTPGMDRIMTAAYTPNMVGSVNTDLSTITNLYIPKVAEPMIEMTELYIYDDELKDMRVVTLADPFVVIFDRPIERMFLKEETPITQVCPNPAYDYFFGHSEVERLVPLQDKRNMRQTEVDHMLNMQANPAKNFSGFPGMTDELALAMDSPGGYVQSETPGAKVDSIAPDIPNDMFQAIREIDMMFEETSGITNVMSGKGESGVRSTGHASQLARLGSSRIKKRALIIEDSLEKVATLYLKLMRKYDKRMYREEGHSPAEQQVFIADQLVDDFVVKVDAHSNSPIFMEDQRELVFELFKIKAITRETLLELLDIPMKELLKQRLKKEIEPSEAAAQKHADEMERLKHPPKVPH